MTNACKRIIRSQHLALNSDAATAAMTEQLNGRPVVSISHWELPRSLT
jgi:hypothetical protein